MSVCGLRKAFVGERWCHTFQAAEGREVSTCLPAASRHCAGAAGARAAATSWLVQARDGLGETTTRVPVNRGLEEPKVAAEASVRSPCCWEVAANGHVVGMVQPLFCLIASSLVLPRQQHEAGGAWAQWGRE